MANTCILPLSQRPLLQSMARRGGTRKRPNRKPRGQRLRPRRNQRTMRRLYAEARFWNHADEWSIETGLPPTLPFFGELNRYPYSNHAMVPTRFKKQLYATSEHAYLAEQARCYGLHRLAEAWTRGSGGVREYGRWYAWDNPKHVKAYSTKAFRPFKDPHNPARKTWISRRDQVMFQIVLSKYKGDRGAKRVLLSSGHRYLVEVSPHDDHWGIGVRLSTDDLQVGPYFTKQKWGDNRLGKITMAVRNILRVRIQQAKLITNRARRYMANRLKASASYRNLQHDAIYTLAHFSRALVPGVKRAVHPRRLALDVAPMETRNYKEHNRGLKRRKLANARPN